MRLCLYMTTGFRSAYNLSTNQSIDVDRRFRRSFDRHGGLGRSQRRILHAQTSHRCRHRFRPFFVDHVEKASKDRSLRTKRRRVGAIQN